VNGLVRDLAAGLAAEKARSAVTCLSLAAGLAAGTLLLSALAGLSREAEQARESFGADTLVAVSEEGPLDAALRRAWREATSDAARSAAFARPEREGDPWAVEAAMPALRNWSLRSGRFPDGADAPWELWRPEEGDGEPPASGGGVSGDDRRVWRVAGVLPRAPDPMLFPAGASFRALAAGEPADGMVFRVREGRDLDAFREEADRLLASLALPARPPVLAWTGADALLSSVDRFREAVAWTAGATAFLALALGASLLGGLMVAKVRNRRHEIGLRRALGATACDVEALFFTEAALVAAVAGLIAMLASAVAVRLLAARSPVPLAWTARVALSPLVSALLLSAACAFFPARAAGRLPPAEALKSE